MTTGRTATMALLVACFGSGLGMGCANQGPLLSRRTSIGMLQSSVSQLEIEKKTLETELADLRADHRRIEERLAEEEASNGELTARLDDARVLLRSRGLDDQELANTVPDASPRTTAPAGRVQRPGRKPPFTRIPSRVASPPSPDDVEFPDADDPLDLPPSRGRDPFGPQSRNQGTSSWLPVAQGRDRSTGGRR